MLCAVSKSWASVRFGVFWISGTSWRDDCKRYFGKDNMIETTYGSVVWGARLEERILGHTAFLGNGIYFAWCNYLHNCYTPSLNSNANVDFGGLFVHVGLLIDTAYHSGLIRILLCTGGGHDLGKRCTFFLFPSVISKLLVLANKSSLLQVSPLQLLSSERDAIAFIYWCSVSFKPLLVVTCQSPTLYCYVLPMKMEYYSCFPGTALFSQQGLQ